MDIKSYCDFVRKLVYKMFYDIYLNTNNLNEVNNLPKPNAFDTEILDGTNIVLKIHNTKPDFEAIYQPGSMNIPLFVFNFTDYKIWMKYANDDINCFGNFAMISADANSSGSNWDQKRN